MSNYKSNPVGALQERFQSRGMKPQYKVVKASGASHAPTFSFLVTMGDLTSTGSGSSKKQAKNAAAMAMLDKLDKLVPAQASQTHVPLVVDTVTGNCVGTLQEMCVKLEYRLPKYDVEPHCRHFSIICSVGNLKKVD